MTLRACLRLLLFAALLLAPVGRIGVARAMAAPDSAAMTHCAGMPAAAAGHHAGMPQKKAPSHDGERMAVDCMTACAAMAPAPAPFVAPPPATTTLPAIPVLFSLTGIRPEADPPPPRFS